MVAVKLLKNARISQVPSLLALLVQSTKTDAGRAPQNELDFQNEISVMSTLRHPNLGKSLSSIICFFLVFLFPNPFFSLSCPPHSPNSGALCTVLFNVYCFYFSTAFPLLQSSCIYISIYIHIYVYDMYIYIMFVCLYVSVYMFILYTYMYRHVQLCVYFPTAFGLIGTR